MRTEELPAREAMEFDVAIVGAGPAGLSAAIRLKQLNPDLTVVVVEKGSEVGAHILSGAVIDPIGLDTLVPEWRTETDTPIKTPVTDDRFYWLGPSGSLRVPNFFMPPLMSNHGNFIVSLGNVCRWQRAELRPLQDMRHQGPEPEHHLGHPRGRRRAKLSEYVTRAAAHGLGKVAGSAKLLYDACGRALGMGVDGQ